MRTATLAALVMAGIVAILAMALWPEPIVTPGGRYERHSDRGLMSREEIGSRPIAAGAAAGMTSDVATGVASAYVAPGGRYERHSDRGPISSDESATAPRAPISLLDLVTIIPHPANASAPRSLTRTEAIDSVMQSPDYQETVSPLARLYFATFGRYPDYEGLNYYTGQREGGSGLPEIAEEFARGREFDMRYGDLSNAEFVARILTNVLGNESQADVRAHWTSELDAGRMTRGQVIVDLAESGMFRERTANQVFVSAAYAEVLQTAPAPADFTRWVAHLNAGNPGRSVIDGLLARR